ncbi:MAG: hypothetical protein JWL77_1171 [Chthonomonadaceae bacterium]|nr:hypothetical protein [Chthonomonadaceae bacterium]
MAQVIAGLFVFTRRRLTILRVNDDKIGAQMDLEINQVRGRASAEPERRLFVKSPLLSWNNLSTAVMSAYENGQITRVLRGA